MISSVGIDYLTVFGKIFQNFQSSELLNFVLYLAFNCIDSSVTDDPFVEEPRVWRKYKILILVSMLIYFLNNV